MLSVRLAAGYQYKEVLKDCRRGGLWPKLGRYERRSVSVAGRWRLAQILAVQAENG